MEMRVRRACERGSCGLLVFTHPRFRDPRVFPVPAAVPGYHSLSPISPTRRSHMSSPSPRDNGLTRRAFLGATGAAALSVVSNPSMPAWADVAESASAKAPAAPESVVKLLYESLTDAQKKVICFDWGHRDPKKGLLRTRVENNWH